MSYVFDNNSLRVLSNYYPDQFPSFWQRFGEAVDSGLVVSVREVRRELDQYSRTDWLLDWLDDHAQLFLSPTSVETAFIAEIFRVPHFQALVGHVQQLRGAPVADPFIVASARVSGRCVVTEEVLKPNAAKIPNVCQYFDIDCTNVRGFLQREGWSF